MNILNIIPARRDSSRYPGKNNLLLHNRPVLQYTVDECPREWTTVVITNDHKFKSTAQSLGIVVIDEPEELATSNVDPRLMTQFAIDRAESIFEKRFDIIVQTIPNSPVRPEGILQRCVDTLIHGGPQVEAAIPCEELRPTGQFRIKDGLVAFTMEYFPTGQEYQQQYTFVGCCDVFWRRNISLDYANMAVAPVICRPGEVFEIDTPDDIVAAKILTKFSSWLTRHEIRPRVSGTEVYLMTGLEGKSRPWDKRVPCGAIVDIPGIGTQVAVMSWRSDVCYWDYECEVWIDYRAGGLDLPSEVRRDPMLAYLVADLDERLRYPWPDAGGSAGRTKT